MDLSKIANSELLGRLEKLTRTERKMTHLILCHINEVESRRLYAELGFDSMFKYLTKYLGYGEDSAYRRLQAARLLKQVPAVAEKIENGALNLTQLTQVQKCLKQEIHLTGKTVKPNNTKSQSLKCEGKLTPSFTTERKRKHVKVTLKRELLKNANHCCEYIAPTTGIKCTSTYQLQVDHRIPLACGGSHSPDNLRDCVAPTICYQHSNGDSHDHALAEKIRLKKITGFQDVCSP
nr:HNH endonuclease signature motif containing protein [uncultured Bdellovibrio sp.]